MQSQAALTSTPSTFLKPFWLAVIGPPWVVSLVFLLGVAAIRFFAVLSPFSLQELFFIQTVATWALPFFMLTAEGRRQIGLSEHGITPSSMLLSALVGGACALMLFALGMAIYGASPNNWCISIRNYLHLEEMRGLFPPLGLFALYAMPAVFLNPIGEEILFRGFIQEAFTRRFNPVFATLVNSLLFGLLYLYLHGVWRDATGFHFHLGSAALAVFLMVCIGTIFTLCRTLSGSLWVAMAAHGAFNLTMLAVIIHQFVR